MSVTPFAVVLATMIRDALQRPPGGLVAGDQRRAVEHRSVDQDLAP
ncbi:MAG: hypothetical protein OXG72_17945 [Acidobacteria bacterium]|nr:hypothetical protein [Acidobacteriota bacterium]